MCGFALISNKNKVYPHLLSHRGIERNEKFINGFQLVHYRLPLQTQIGDNWSQPIPIDGGYVLFNGEIFNYHDFNDMEFPNDTAYLQWFFNQKDWLYKSHELNQWDGFWSIIVVKEDCIIYFTDPLGKKQLYYTDDGNFASEIKPLINKTEFEKDFPWDKPVETHLTPFKGVYRVKPNTINYWGKDGKRTIVTDYFSWCTIVPTDLRSLISKSVRDRFINTLDRNTLFVSGGLDSTIILHELYLQGKLNDVDLLTIENQDDEPFIKVIEEKYSVNVRRIKYPFGIDYKGILYRYEYPLEFGSLVPQSELVNSSKGSVIYTGDGADELFGGYQRAFDSDTQKFDVFIELPYYHMIRLDRVGMSRTKEIRTPFLSHNIVRYALNLPWEKRRGKEILKEIYKDLPKEILERSKQALRHPQMVQNRNQYTNSIHELFKSIKYA